MHAKRTTLTTLSAVVLASLLSAATASAAYESYIKIKGSKQGQIKASESASKTDPAAFHIESYKMLDPSGAPVGKRKHMPIVITREIDSASPKLLQALSTNETLTDLVIQSSDPSSKSAPLIAIQATNARVTSINHVASDGQHPSLTKGKAYEEISFAYEKVQLTRGQAAPETDTWE